MSSSRIMGRVIINLANKYPLSAMAVFYIAASGTMYHFLEDRFAKYPDRHPLYMTRYPSPWSFPENILKSGDYSPSPSPELK